MKTVGIIGGLGPETTSEFYLDLILSCQKMNRSNRPSIIIASVPLPYSIEDDAILKNVKVERCLPFLINEAKRLEISGADFIVMPCNSLHIFIKNIRDSVKIPVLSIVEETVKFILINNIKKVGLVSTSVTINNKLYEKLFKENNIICVIPNDFKQEKIGKVIQNLVNGMKSNRDREEIIEIINDLDRENVDCVILACTDLQLLMPTYQTLRIFDTMKIFADATVSYMLQNSNNI